jgi:outer membrane protein
MKEKVIIGLNVVLAFAVALLFLLHFKGKGQCCKSTKPGMESTATVAVNHNSSIAYINSDTVLNNYTLYHKLKSEIEAKQSRLEGDYSAKMKKLEGDYYQYQEKAQKNLLTRAEMQQQEMSLQQRQQEMSVLNQKLTEELGKDEQKIQKQLYDSVKLVTDLYNQEYKYQVIFNSSTSVSIITADKSLDITQDIVKLLNKRYKSDK